VNFPRGTIPLGTDPKTLWKSGQQPVTTSLDDAPLSSFHKRLAAYASGGAFMQGYILSITGVAMVQIAPQLNLSPAAGFGRGIGSGRRSARCLSVAFWPTSSDAKRAVLVGARTNDRVFH
jgi:hypothetical protein